MEEAQKKAIFDRGYRQGKEDFRPVLDPEEAAAMMHLVKVYDAIEKWGLRANHIELTSAIHVIQGFIVQHMLQRTAGESWSAWYDVATEMKEKE